MSVFAPESPHFEFRVYTCPPLRTGGEAAQRSIPGYLHIPLLSLLGDKVGLLLGGHFRAPQLGCVHLLFSVVGEDWLLFSLFRFLRSLSLFSSNNLKSH